MQVFKGVILSLEIISVSKIKCEKSYVCVIELLTDWKLTKGRHKPRSYAQIDALAGLPTIYKSNKM